jgi:hypothetical protein
VDDRSCSSASDVSRRPSFFAFLVGEVQVQQHEDAGLGVDAQQRDEPTQTAMLML